MNKPCPPPRQISRMLPLLRPRALSRSRYIREWFHRMDADGSGHVTHGELMKSLRKQNIPEKDGAALSAQLDVDGDGEVSYGVIGCHRMS